MTREEAANVLWWASKQHHPGDQMDITEYVIEAFDVAIAALRPNGWVKTSESMVETLKQACPYCSWIDPSLLEDDPEDGPLNYCRVCGRDLRR